MSKNAAIMELVAGYEHYATPQEVAHSASSDAPESSPVCLAAASASSMPCYYASLTFVTMC